MNTTSIHHRPAAFVAVAAAGCAAALLAVTVNTAQARPEGDGYRTVPVSTVQTPGDPAERACFIEPLTWNEALDGPLPRCRTYLP